MATVGEIAREVMNLASVTNYLVIARKWIPARYNQLLAAHPSALRETLGEVVIPATYSTGTVAATRGSTTITGTGTTFVAAHAGRHIQISSAWYAISTFDSATQLTLSSAFAEDTVTASTYLIAPRNILLVADARRFLLDSFTLARTGTPLELLSPDQFSALFPRPDSTGTPKHVIFRGVDSNNDHIIEVYPYPTLTELVTFIYYSGPPTLTESSNIPDLIDPHILREAALIDAYNYRANLAASANNIDQAAYFTNRANQQRTIWDRLIREAIFTTTPANTGRLSIPPATASRRRFTNRDPFGRLASDAV